MLMFNPCEEIYGPWKHNEVQNHHTCIYHANFQACRGPWNWIWNLQDPTGIEFPDRKQIKEPYLQIYCQSSRAKHGTLNGLEICHCQKLMPQINVQKNRELGVATEGPDKPPKIFSVSVKYPWNLREMRCLPVKCGVYLWNAMFTRGKEPPLEWFCVFVFFPGFVKPVWSSGCQPHLNCLSRMPVPWCLLFPRLSLGASRAKHLLSCKI